MYRIYSEILKNIVLPLADKTMQTKISYYLKKIRQMNDWSKDAITDWQEQKLKKLVTHAYNETKYYNELFKKIGINPDNIKTLDDLKKIPPLTKEIIKNNFEAITPKNLSIIPHKKSSTGGSTGEPLVYFLDYESWSFIHANQILNWEKTGYRYGDKFIALGSTSLLVEKQKSLKHDIYYKLKNKIGLNGINMADNVCSSYISFIKKSKIKYIYGYASSIYMLAKYLLKNKEDLIIKVCFPTSEVLTDIYRTTIEKAFRCKVLNGYGANDGGVSAYEHVIGFFEVGYNSIVNTRNSGQNNGSPALLTDLLNFAMPLINYQLGDEIVIDNTAHNHLYNGQIINKVMGRTSDIIELENGNSITGPGFTVLFGKLPVDYYYIEKDGYNSIKCLIKKRSDFQKEHLDLILTTLEKQCGKDVKINMNYIEEIKYTNSGKIKYFG